MRKIILNFSSLIMLGLLVGISYGFGLIWLLLLLVVAVVESWRSIEAAEFVVIV